MACYTDRNGRQMKKSTKTTDRGQAMQIALEPEGVEGKARPFNSTLANAGVSNEVRMKLTGHKSPEMNDRYTHLQMETLKSAMDAMPLFGVEK